MFKVKSFFLPGFVLLASQTILLASCTTDSQEKNEINKAPGALDIILCKEPRPEICTREYNPVCATLKDGSIRTDSTACTACSDPAVIGYNMGACGVASVK